MQTTEHAVEPKIQGMDEGGWSNSEPVKDAPADVYPDVQVQTAPEPGWTNGTAVAADDDETPRKSRASKK